MIDTNIKALKNKCIANTQGKMDNKLIRSSLLRAAAAALAPGWEHHTACYGSHSRKLSWHCPWSSHRGHCGDCLL